MRSSQSRRLLLVITAVLTMAGCASTSDVEELRTEISALQEQVDSLQASLAVITLSDPSNEIDGVRNEVRAVADEVGLMADDIDSISRRVVEVGDQADINSFGLEDVKSCVNEYMDTIGTWSSNLNTTFTYFYC